jgi:hypothetical protein
MLDIKSFKANAARLGTIREAFGSSEANAQSAFEDLVNYCVEVFDSARPAPGKAPQRGIQSALRKELELNGFKEGHLSSTYINPSLNLASRLCDTEVAPVVSFVWDHFLDCGDELEGSVVVGPLYTPTRLNALGGMLTSKDKSNVVQPTLDGLEVSGKPFHTLTVAAIKEAVKGEVGDPEVVNVLRSALGNPKDFERNPGTLMKVVRDIDKANLVCKSDELNALARSFERQILEARQNIEVIIMADEKAKAEKSLEDAMARRNEKLKATA